RRRSPTAATARRTVSRTPSGSQPGTPRFSANHRVAVETAPLREGSAAGGALRALSRFAWRRPGLKIAVELSPPLIAFLCVYVAALVALLVSAFWSVNDFTSEVEHTWGLGNFHELLHNPAWRTVTLRTVGIASAVTATCIVLAIPYAYFL